jgi:hypothetical protein
MGGLSVTIREGQPALIVHSQSDLDRAVSAAVEESKRRGYLGLIDLEASGGNTLSIVIGSDETVLSFVHGHGNPPYYASRGATDAIDPVLTCFLHFGHHTEFPRRHVISMAQGINAAREFLGVNELPKAIAWDEV